MERRLWGAHPLAWAAVFGVVALLAILLASIVFADPHRVERRLFVRACREEARDRGLPDRCDASALLRFGPVDHLWQNVAYVVAAVAVFAGTVFSIIFISRRVGESIERIGQDSSP